MPEPQFLKTLIFPRALLKLQIWVNFSFFQFFSVSIIKKMMFMASAKLNSIKS